jgi:hypothetical protein
MEAAQRRERLQRAPGEVRRLLAHLITQIPGRAAAWAWSTWRRRHQHRARTSHYQRRQADYNEVRLSY